MNAVALLVRLAWALVHFLWQGALLGVVAWGVLALLRRHRPEVRYAAACLFLGGCLALPLLTFLVQGMPAVVPTAEVARTAGYQAVMSLRRLVVGHLPLLLGLWGLGSLILGLRAGASWLWLARLERRATEIVDAQVLHLLERLEARLGLTQPVRLMASERVRGPFVQGLWRPIVFVPVGFVTGLDPKALEAVLAHELAHVRRLDVLVIGLQTVIETLLYYHPVTWWLSHRVSTEREHCCDAFAVEMCGDPVLLAKTLSRFADLAQAGAPALAGGDLMERIQRILNLESGPARFPAPLLSAGLALSATVLLARQPELRELVFQLPAQGRQVALQVQGVAAAVQEPLPDPVETATGAGAAPAGIHGTALPAPAGDPMPQPQEALGAAPAPAMRTLPSNVWEEGRRAEAEARAFKRPLVLVVTRTEAEREAVLAHLSTLEGAEWRSRAEFWLARPGDAQAAACLDLNQVRSLPALLAMEVGKTRALKGVRMGSEALPWGAALSHLLKDEAPLTAEAVQAWAGKDVDPAPFLAFAKARKAALSAGLQEPHQRWLRALAATGPQPVKHWAVTRLFEAGALEARDGVDPWTTYAEIREADFRKEVLRGNQKQAPVSTPRALGLTGVIPPEAPCWAQVKRELRMAKEARVGTSLYALMAPVLEASDRDWVLGQCHLLPAGGARPAETYALYWMVLDWLICYGNAQDWDTFQASVTESWKAPLAGIRKQLERIPAYWAVSAELQALLCGTENPEAFWRNPDPCLEAIGATREHLVQLGMQPLKARHQPSPGFYPEVARRYRLSGTLQLRILTDAQGKVHRVRPLPGYGLWALGPYGLEYASRWAFEPAVVAGKPIPAAFRLTMPFVLK